MIETTLKNRGRAHTRALGDSNPAQYDPLSAEWPAPPVLISINAMLGPPWGSKSQGPGLTSSAALPTRRPSPIMGNVGEWGGAAHRARIP